MKSNSDGVYRFNTTDVMAFWCRLMSCIMKLKKNGRTFSSQKKIKGILIQSTGKMEQIQGKSNKAEESFQFEAIGAIEMGNVVPYFKIEVENGKKYGKLRKMGT